MAFDDPNYTKAKMGSGIGNLLAGYTGAAQKKQGLDLARKELAMKDPNRQPGIMDLLGVAGDIYKAQSVYSMMPGMGPTPAFDPNRFKNIIEGLQGLQASLGQPTGMPAPGPAMPGMAPAAGGAAPASVQKPTSVLNKYLVNQAEQRSPMAPAAPGMPPAGAVPAPVSVNRAGGPSKDYSSLWR